MRYPQTNRPARGRADLIALVVLLGCGILASSLDTGQQLRVAAVLRSSVLWPFVEFHHGFGERALLAERFARVRAERDSLVREIVESRQAAEEGRQLRRLLELGPRAAGDFLPAELVAGRPRVGDADVFVLRGKEVSSVVPPAGVAAGDRVVGVVRAVNASGGLGEFWTHPDFRVSVRTVTGDVTGIVRPVQRDEGGALMLLEGAPYQGEVPPGTPLFTTGLTGIYPPGLWVGTVRELWGVETGWTKSYAVEPAMRPEAADIVLVWRRPDGEAP